jgi:hypothetical protein
MSLDDFSVDSTGVEAQDVESRSGGAAVSKPGWGHFIIREVRDDTPTDKVGLACACFVCEMIGFAVDGKNADEKGKSVYHRIWLQSWLDDEKTIPGVLSDNSRNLVLRFALGIGLIRQDQLGVAGLRIPWTAAAEFQFVACLEAEEYTTQGGEKKTQYRIPFNNVFAVNSDEATHHVALDMEYAQLLMGPPGTPAPVAQPNAAPAVAPSPQPAPQPAPQQAAPAVPPGTVPQYAPVGAGAAPAVAPVQAAPVPQQAPFGQPNATIPQQAPAPQQAAPVQQPAPAQPAPQQDPNKPGPPPAGTINQFVGEF